jgi:hypothetical protein
MQILSYSVKGALAVLGAGFGMARNVGGAVGRTWLLLLLGLMVVPGLLRAQPAANYYVATTGLDTNPGSYAQPFATISHALTLCSGGETVAVAAGTYSTLTYTATLDGIATGAVIYDKKTRTSMVTVEGWGATQPLIQAPTGGDYMALFMDGGQYVTFQNFAFASNNDYSSHFGLVTIYPTFGTPTPHDVVLDGCDLTDPDSGDTATHGNPCVFIGYGAYNLTVEDSTIHNSESGITGPGEASAADVCNNINILDNTLNTFTGDAMQFGAWSNVTIDGNIIENMVDAAGNTFHNDGIQMTGNIENVAVTHNVIHHSSGQLMLIQPDVGPEDQVLVENNLIWDTNVGNGGFAVQSSGTHAAFINNTISDSHYGGLLLRSYGSITPNDTVVANNSLCGFGFAGGATCAYENYNYLPSGQGTGAKDIFGTNPDYVNSSAGNFHPATGSPLLAAGVHSFSATVDGSVTNFTAPTDDLDFLTRGNPPAIGAYDSTLGNYTMSYSGFDYATTGTIGSLTDGAADFGWTQTTWSGNNQVVSPGLTYNALPVLGLALSFSSNVAADRTINPSVFPPGYGVVGTDGVARLGAAGTTVWLSFLIDPTEADGTNALTCGVNLEGQATNGGTKLTIGDFGSAGAGYWGLNDPAYGGGSVASSVPITTGQTVFLVVEIQFVTGGSDVVNLWVNPALGKTTPATPSATLSGHTIYPFGVMEFKGNRVSTGDELSVGTSWLSVTSGGDAGF